MTQQDLLVVNLILEEYLSFTTDAKKYFISTNNDIVEAFREKIQKIKNNNKANSYLFNALRFFKIDELLHSSLLAYLLDPNEDHGQESLFLKSFLQLLNIEVDEKDHWIVTAEKGRIDILLKRRHPHTVIIIENKSNKAGDGNNQLYRYWYQEIYLPNQQYGEKTIEKTSNNKNYQIIYLTHEGKIPSDHTMEKPGGYDPFLPDRIPIEPEIWLFSGKIVDWLSNSIKLLQPENHRLREYLMQYIGLWT